MVKQRTKNARFVPVVALCIVLSLCGLVRSASAQEATADSAWRRGDTERAAALYGAMLQADSSNAVALHRVALMRAWKRDFPTSLHLFDRLLALQPNDTDARVDRARVLAWKGETHGAIASLDSIIAREPNNETATQLRAQIKSWIATSVRPRFLYENDSDENSILTWSADATFHPALNWEIRPDGYVRTADVGSNSIQPNEQAAGGGVGIWHMLESGWALYGYGGASRKFGAARAALTTPVQHALVGSLSYAFGALDATAVLIEREVTTGELTGTVTYTTKDSTMATVSASTTSYKGHVSGLSNQRWLASALVTHRVSKVVEGGVNVRAFGFDKDLSDGYFDPNFYGTLEAVARLRYEKSRFLLTADIAPGVQQVGKDANTSGTLRGSGRLTYMLGTGRSMEAFVTYAKSGINQLSQIQTDQYRYHSFGISSNWTF